jgi:hypothetical protein
MSKLYTEAAAGRYIGGEDDPVSQRTMQYWRATGQGPQFLKIGHLVRYEQAALDAFIEACRRGADPQRAA